MRSVAIANQKGGVGKTTTALHLAFGLALRGERVALLDLDPQGNATMCASKGEPPPPSGLEEVATGFWLKRAPPHESTPDLPSLRSTTNRLAEDGFDWVIADCPPRVDEWAWAGLSLCDQVLIPVQTEFFALQGLSQIFAAIRDGQSGPTKILGVLPTMVDLGEQIHREVIEDLRRNLGAQLLDSVILWDAEVVEAQSHGQTVFAYNPAGKAALCFTELVMEVASG